jgi:hypothetical protein
MPYYQIIHIRDKFDITSDINRNNLRSKK